MSVGILGKKLGMTQLYDEKGVLHPATIIAAGPCTVLQKKSVEKEKYSSYQLGFFDAKEKNTPKIDAVLVIGAVSVDARKVQVRTTAGQVYTADAVATPVSERLRSFAVVIPKKDAKVTSIKPLNSNGLLADAPTGLPATGGPCVVHPANCATAQPGG